MVAKVNLKREMSQEVELAIDINNKMYNHCHLSLRGLNCEECKECSVYGRLVAVTEYTCDFECDVEECNDCSIICYQAYAYFEDDISEEDARRFTYEGEKMVF